MYVILQPCLGFYHSYLAGSKVVKRGHITIKKQQWYTLNLNAQVRVFAKHYRGMHMLSLLILLQKETVTIRVDNMELATAKTSSQAGFVGIGTSSFIRAAFDNIQISDGESVCDYVTTIVTTCLVS